ncbi:ABC transporter family protein (fragment) [Carnobacterium maltaromaticum]
MLKVKDLSVHYGVIQAINKINFEVHEGEIVSLIGANGAGKSTILKAISGLYRPSEGEILFKDTPIQKHPLKKL